MRRSIQLNDPLLDYVEKVGVREHPVLAKCRRETASLGDVARMQIAPEQGAAMAMFARLIGARRTLEVGVFTGYSTLSVALALPPDGQIVACDVSEEWTARAKSYWKEAGVAGKITLKLAPAQETLDTLVKAGETGHFDMAFIDADKTGYDAYYERALTLLRPGGLIIVDNVLWGGHVVDAADQSEGTRAIRVLNDKIHRDERVDIALLPFSDGLTLVRKR